MKHLYNKEKYVNSHEIENIHATAKNRLSFHKRVFALLNGTILIEKKKSKKFCNQGQAENEVHFLFQLLKRGKSQKIVFPKN